MRPQLTSTVIPLLRDGKTAQEITQITGIHGKRISQIAIRSGIRPPKRDSAVRILTQDTTPEEFWRNVDKSPGHGRDGDCWIVKSQTQLGYGRITLNGHRTTATRLSWILEYGAIPDSLFVLHHCDNPACVRPEHLFLGTQSDNIQDCAIKGRHAKTKYTAAQVEKFKTDVCSGIAPFLAARRNGILVESSYSIIKGESWRWVPWPDGGSMARLLNERAITNPGVRSPEAGIGLDRALSIERYCRNTSLSARQIALKHGVCHGTVQKIRKGLRVMHV